MQFSPYIYASHVILVNKYFFLKVPKYNYFVFLSSLDSCFFIYNYPLPFQDLEKFLILKPLAFPLVL
jgi:hypothetical protein